MRLHDSTFKELLGEFFADLLRLTVPEVAARLDLERSAPRDKELFTPEGRRRELDLLVWVAVPGDGDQAVLVHVEVESRARAGMGRRLWRYRNRVLARHDRHVLSIVVYLTRGPRGVQVRTLEDDPFGQGWEDFRYAAFGLAGCDPGEYLARPEPLAWALAALMRGGTLARPALKLACLRRIAAANLSEKRRLLLVNCVESYLELQPEEAAEFAALCTVPENREVKTMATSWAERLEAKGMHAGMQKGLQKGRKEGLHAMRKALLSLLEQRFGPLPEATRERVEAISSLQRLSRLASRVLSARSLAALRL